MLYPKNSQDELSKELFVNPTSEYRGTPFWAWNCKLEKDMLLKQIGQLKEMGMGGAHIHCRIGLGTEYLGKEFMDLVKACDDKFKEENMLCWLYDEDRWPSGSAGGLVTKDEKYRARFLLFSPKQLNEDTDSADTAEITGRTLRNGKRKLIGKYEVCIEDGYLKYYKKIDAKEQPSMGGKVWWAYLEVSGNNPWFNNQAYVNTLDREAINKFIEMTHESYYRELGEEFGKSIPAIFTDEPQFTHKEFLGFAEEERDIALPFTDDFDESYRNTYGNSILDYLPELIWELSQGEISTARYRYHDHLCERFAAAFSDTIGSWCREHGIMLTGHMMEEPTLSSQTKALGEAMRSYRSFQLPGIDMLCDWREFSTAKQAQSASGQYGCPGVLSEIYGVTNWDFDFRGHKLAGDWQAALGVTTRVHHLTWVSMEGEAKRDYPACIGYQSPWYREYSMLENHFSRLNTAMTRGKQQVRVGMIHPIESYWLHFGPQEQTGIIREEMETNFKNIIDWLLFGMIDFHFIAESLLPSQCDAVPGKALKVGEMEYDVILVPGNETLRASTVERLEAFSRAGGRVIFIGEPARLVDAEKCDRVEKFAEYCTKIPFTRSRILDVLEPYREIDIRTERGSRSDNLFYQMRMDGDSRWLFICHVNKMQNPDLASIEKINIKIKGSWVPTIYDTMTGEIKPCSSDLINGCTQILHEFSQHGSLLLYLEPGVPYKRQSEEKMNYSLKELWLDDCVPVSLSEPNVLLLDTAEYSLDDGEWMPREEILRIDSIVRRELGYDLRMDAMAQPWVNTEKEGFEHKLRLRFTIDSEIEVKAPELALENAQNTVIFVNGSRIASKINGWYVDECIKKVVLPSLPAGRSTIMLEIPFNSKTDIEWCYLLGDFGVRTAGSHAEIIEPVRSLYFGDWTNQGLPFYAGNVTYHCQAASDGGEIIVEVPQFRNPLLSVSLDDQRSGVIALAPYSLNIGQVEKGVHCIDITAYGNRINAFGTVHNCNRTTFWFGQDAWRTTGSSWSYEYQLKEMGILTKPFVISRSLDRSNGMN